jgi:RNA polymerase sigma-70 factor, ECF subfamily
MNEHVNAAMSAYAAGDARAFAIVYAALAPRVTALLVARGAGRELARDLTQATFEHIHVARSGYEHGRDVHAWAFTIAHRLLVDHWRSATRQELVARTWAREAASPADELAAIRTARGIGLALEALSPAQRDAWRLVRLRGLSLAAAAHALRVSVCAVKLRLHRADAALRAAGEG